MVRNVRLVYMIPIVHDLIKHFHAVEMDYIPGGKNNSEPRKLAKEACMYAMGATLEQPDLFKIKF